MKRPTKRKKIDKGNGMSIFSGETKEILKRMKDKEPELAEIVERDTEPKPSMPVNENDGG
ncbi:MAG: hypothetical protein HQK99_14610 [Nitrospirae bacterium]|nr:hypothetical protein [Nitrospirota bacterium]